MRGMEGKLKNSSPTNSLRVSLNVSPPFQGGDRLFAQQIIRGGQATAICREANKKGITKVGNNRQYLFFKTLHETFMKNDQYKIIITSLSIQNI
jgi:hypothetical protein